MSYKATETVFQQGETGETFYIIYTGKVAIYVNFVDKITGETNKKMVVELSQGKSFGEMALLNDEPRSATVITIEPTDLIQLDKITYDKIVKGQQMEQID